MTEGDLEKHPFLWQNGKMYDLKVGYEQCYHPNERSRHAFNNRGEAVGTCAVLGQFATESFLWQRGKVANLGSLGGTLTNVAAINDHGQVVGSSAIGFSDFTQHGFLWQDGKMIDLGTLGGSFKHSFAGGINESGLIFGNSIDFVSGQQRAVLWIKPKE